MDDLVQRLKEMDKVAARLKALFCCCCFFFLSSLPIIFATLLDSEVSHYSCACVCLARFFFPHFNPQVRTMYGFIVITHLHRWFPLDMHAQNFNLLTAWRFIGSSSIDSLLMHQPRFQVTFIAATRKNTHINTECRVKNFFFCPLIVIDCENHTMFSAHSYTYYKKRARNSCVARPHRQGFGVITLALLSCVFLFYNNISAGARSFFLLFLSSKAKKVYKYTAAYNVLIYVLFTYF